jgi:ferredoxin--NADP+ reductase
MPDLPFDRTRGVIPSDRARVIDGTTPVPGAYVTGWIRRGAQGIIGSNKKCARDCVDALLEDAVRGALPRNGTLDAASVLAHLTRRAPALTRYDDWQQIDRIERRDGTRAARPRVKLTSLNALLAAAHARDI